MITIREASVSDISEMMEVVKASWRSVYPTFIASDIVEDLITKRQTVEIFYKDLNGGYAIVAHDSAGKLIGVATVLIQHRFVFLRRLYVFPAAQGQGVGTQLLNYLVDYFSEDKASIILDVEILNKKAVKFYITHGFEAVRDFSQEVVPGLTLDYIGMRKLLKK